MQITSYFSPLLQGAYVTAALTLLSAAIGLLLSFAIGLSSRSPNPLARGFSLCWIEFFRGTPLLVQLFWLYFALPLVGQAIGIDLRMPPLVAGVLALAIHNSAYGAEIVRGALQSVPRSQLEAARALNFGPYKTVRCITLPQAIPEMIPAFGNLLVQNMKDTALVSLISLGDLALRAQQLRNYTQDNITVYSIVIVLYFLMALLLSFFVKLVERRVNRWRPVRG